MYVKSKRRHTQLQRRIDKYHLRNEVIAGDGNLRMLLLIGNDGCSGQYTSDVMCGTDAETDFRRHSEYKVLHNLFSLSYFSMASFLRAYHTAYIISNKHAKEKAEHMPCFSATYGTFRLLFICRFAYSMQKYIDFPYFSSSMSVKPRPSPHTVFTCITVTNADGSTSMRYFLMTMLSRGEQRTISCFLCCPVYSPTIS